MIESFWSGMQVELLDWKRWSTRIELASAIFEYLEISHNRQRRHSSLSMSSTAAPPAATSASVCCRLNSV
jgi:Integrase core domain